MKRTVEEIVKEVGNDGFTVYRYADKELAITYERITEKVGLGDDTLEWRFILMAEKLKSYVSLLADSVDNPPTPLMAVIRDIEREMMEIHSMVKNTLGDIVFLYHDYAKAWPGYVDDRLIGLAYRPLNGVPTVQRMRTP